MAEIVRTADEINELCSRAKAAIQWPERDPAGQVEIGYAYGVFDALRWILGLPEPSPEDEIGPITAEEIASLLARLDTQPSSGNPNAS